MVDDEKITNHDKAIFVCPECKSNNISAHDGTSEGQYYVQNVTCDDCGADFIETYKFVEWKKNS